MYQIDMKEVKSARPLRAKCIYNELSTNQSPLFSANVMRRGHPANIQLTATEQRISSV
jgi:hypothetical protein